MPAGGAGSSSLFLALGPLVENVAPANLRSEDVIVFEFTPGRVRFMVSMVRFIMPTFMIYTWIDEGAEYTVTLNFELMGTLKEGHCIWTFSLLAT